MGEARVPTLRTDVDGIDHDEPIIVGRPGEQRCTTVREILEGLRREVPDPDSLEAITDPHWHLKRRVAAEALQELLATAIWCEPA